jgi:hypothetical protein
LDPVVEPEQAAMDALQVVNSVIAGIYVGTR